MSTTISELHWKLSVKLVGKQKQMDVVMQWQGQIFVQSISFQHVQ
jgi:hypothetical protein